MMRATGLLCGLMLLALLPAFAQGWKPVARYSGFLHAGGPDGPDPGGLVVIRDAKAYEAFISRIPTEEISQTRPAPPSDDPLLRRPAVDWSKSMALAAYSGDFFTRVRIESVGPDGAVKVTRQKSDEMAAVPLGVGRYDLVVIPRQDGEFREVR